MDLPRPRVYVETTIPSAYYTDRDDPEMVLRRERTRRWWALAAESSEFVTSLAVLKELMRGKSRHVPSRLALLQGLPLLESAGVRQTAQQYIASKLMPARPSDDALHLALASHHHCDVLVTWNYRHLANATKFDRIRRLNAQLGLSVPLITTPTDLLGGKDEGELAPRSPA